MNYTKEEVKNKLNGYTVKELAEKVDCYSTVIYAYMKGTLSKKSKYMPLIQEALGLPVEDFQPSVEQITGMKPEELAQAAGVSRASVFNWRQRYLEKIKITQPVDRKIEEVFQ